MLPFRVDLVSRLPVSGQVVYAVKKAIITGQLLPGDRFPSVRVLSQELRINPNTAHKIVATLIEDRILEVEPGIGTVVAELPAREKGERGALLGAEVEHLVVEAKRRRLELDDLLEAVRRQWRRLRKPGEELK